MKGLREEMKAVEVDDNPDKRIRRALYEVFRELPENHLKAVSYMSKGMDPMLGLAVNAAVDEIIERTPELKKRYDEIYKRLSERDRRIKKECNRIGKDQTPYLQSKRFKDDVYRRLKQGLELLRYSQDEEDQRRLQACQVRPPEVERQGEGGLAVQEGRRLKRRGRQGRMVILR